MLERFSHEFRDSDAGPMSYTSPEVILGQCTEETRFMKDWWAVGIIIFEILFGFTPFEYETVEETRQAILEGLKPM